MGSALIALFPGRDVRQGMKEGVNFVRQGILLRIVLRRILVPHSVLDLHEATENAICANPAIDATSIVSNLKTVLLDRLYDMKILCPSHFAKNDIVDRERRCVYRRHGAELSRLDLGRH